MIRLPRRTAVALATAVVCGASLCLGSIERVAALGLPAGSLGPAVQAPTPDPSPAIAATWCAVSTTTHLAPGAFLLGEPVAITRTLQPRCINPPHPKHLVLVLDGTEAMAGEPAAELDRAMRAFVASLATTLDEDARVAVVSFDGVAREVCPFTDQLDQVQRCIGRIGNRGNAPLADGLRLARRTMIAGRALWPAAVAESIAETILMASVGPSEDHCDEAQDEVAQLSAAGILTVAVCVGRACNVGCMRSLASSPRYYLEARSTSQLATILSQVIVDYVAPRIESATITETLPVHMSLVEGSVDPPPSTVKRRPTRLVWTVSRNLRDGLTVTYRVRPLAPGYRPLSDGMRGTFRETGGGMGAFELSVPWARVLAPPALSTPGP